MKAPRIDRSKAGGWAGAIGLAAAFWFVFAVTIGVL